MDPAKKVAVIHVASSVDREDESAILEILIIRQGIQLKSKATSTISSVLIFLFPALTLTLKTSVNVCFIGLLVTAILYSLGKKPVSEDRRIPPFLAFSFFFFPFVILVQFAVTGQCNWASFDAPSRFLLAIPILYFLPRMPIDHLKLFRLGCFVGAVGAFIWAIYSLTYMGEFRARSYFTNQIPFGCISLLLALMSCGPVTGARWRKLLVLAGFLAGLVASYLSQSRGVYLLLPIVAFIWLHFFFDIDLKVKVLSILALLVVLFGVYAGSNVVNQRINTGVAEFLDSARNDTHIGIRKQLWAASIDLARQNPFLGVGKGNFHNSVQDLADRGEISLEAAMHSHSHNEMLFALAEIGVPGLIGILLLYLGPLQYFWKYKKDDDAEIRTVSMLGITLICGYAIFGLNDSMFTLSMQTAFFALCVVTLFSHIEARLTFLGRRSSLKMVSTAWSTPIGGNSV